MKITIGNDFRISWSLSQLGEAFTLEGKVYELVVRSSYGVIDVVNYIVDGNTLSFTIPASSQIYTGSYGVILNIAYGDNHWRLCHRDVFELVPCGGEIAGIVQLEDNIIYPYNGLTAYELAVASGEYTGDYEGYQRWLARYAEATAGQALDTAQQANATASEANTIAEQANATADEAKETAEQAMSVAGNYVSYEAQAPTADEQWQARNNIGAPGVNDYAPGMSVGVADNLTGRGEAIEREFVFDQSAGVTTSILKEDTARIESIQGNTLVWNLPITNNKMTDGTNGWSAASIRPSSVLLTYDETEKAIRYEWLRKAYYYVINENSILPVVGHKYFFRVTYKATGATSTLSRIAGAWATEYFTNSEDYKTVKGIIVGGNNSASLVSLFGEMDVGAVAYFREITVIDLTKMFGAGNEPTTAEEAEKIINQLNVADGYNTGQLINNNTTAIKTVGFNAYNGEYAQVIGGATYELLGTFDSIGFTANIGGELTAITIPANLQYTPAEDGYIYAEGSDICIHLVNTGYRNGEYEPYREFTRELPTVEGGLKSAGAVYDELRYNHLTDKWEYIKRVCERAYAEGDDSDTSVVTDGTTTYYALDEAVTTVLDTDLSPDYDVEDWGTEEAIQVTPSSPFKAMIKYGFNAVDQIRGNKLNIDDLLTRVAALEAQLVSLTTNTNNDETTA